MTQTIEHLQARVAELEAENSELKHAREFDSARTGVLARLVGAAWPDSKSVQLECIGTILGSVRLATEAVIKERDAAQAAVECAVAALKWVDMWAFDQPELRERARMALATIKESEVK